MPVSSLYPRLPEQCKGAGWLSGAFSKPVNLMPLDKDLEVRCKRNKYLWYPMTLNPEEDWGGVLRHVPVLEWPTGHFYSGAQHSLSFPFWTQTVISQLGKEMFQQGRYPEVWLAAVSFSVKHRSSQIGVCLPVRCLYRNDFLFLMVISYKKHLFCFEFQIHMEVVP